MNGFTSQRSRVAWLVAVGLTIAGAAAAQSDNPSLRGLEPQGGPGGAPPPLGGGCPGVDLLVSQGSDGGSGFNYFYGGDRWPEMTAALDAAAATVTVTPDLEDDGFVLGFDALWVDQRWTGGSLSAAEQATLASFLATGRRVVLIGENSSWSGWNDDILGVVGGSYAGGETTGILNTVLVHEITTGVSQVETLADGVAVGGTPVFDQNVATLWGENALSILSVNMMAEAWSSVDNATFFTNVAAWLACIPVPVELQSFAVE